MDHSFCLRARVRVPCLAVRRVASGWNSTLQAVLLAGLALGAAGTRGADVSFNFSLNPNTTAGLRIGGQRVSPRIWSPAGGNAGGFLGFTWPLSNLFAAVAFPETDEGRTVERFRFECSVRMGNGSTDRPADGFSISFARLDDPVLGVSGMEDPRYFAGGLPEAGTSTGLVVAFDSWDGNVLPDGTPDVEGILVRFDNETVGRFPLPTRNGACEDPTSLQTGPRNAAYWDAGGDPLAPGSWDTLCWQPLVIELDVLGRVTVTWKGAVVVNRLPTSWRPQSGRFVVAGRTGGANQHCHLDNIRITTTVAPIVLDPRPPKDLRVTLTGARHVALAWSAPPWPGGAPLLYDVFRDGFIVGQNLREARFEEFGLVPLSAYSYVVRAKATDGRYSTRTTLAVSTVAEVAGVGFALAEVYDGFGGSGQGDMESVLRDPQFPRNPSRSYYLDGLSFGEPGFGNTYGENLAVRITTVLVPPATGLYRFFVRSDDASRLYLNLEGPSIPDPARSLPVAQENGCCGSFEEPGKGGNSEDGTFPTSEAILLTAGRRYGVLFLVKEGVGGDWGQVAWRREGDTTPAERLPPIRGAAISSPVDPVGASVTVLREPSNQVVNLSRSATFSFGVDAVSPYALKPSFQWYRNGIPVPGATTDSYTIPTVRAIDSGSRVHCVAAIPGASVTSRIATLTVLPSVAPRIHEVTGNDSFTEVLVTFDQPVTAATAANASNYSLFGLVVTSATVLDNSTVRLGTSRQTEGATYTLRVVGVQNLQGQTILPGSSATFASWVLQSHRVRAELFRNVDGSVQENLDGFLLSPRWTSAPDEIRYLAGMTFGEPAFGNTWGDQYVVALKAILRPKVSGQYRLFVRSDDASRLYLNRHGPFITNTVEDNLVAKENGCCGNFEEPGEGGNPEDSSFPTSDVISLTAGQRYGLLFLVKEGVGGDWGQVAWRREGDLTPAIALSPLSEVVEWYGPAGAARMEPADRFESAPSIALSSTGLVRISTASFTKQYGEPNHAGRLGGASAWLIWRPTSSGIATLTLESSSFDAILAVYTNRLESAVTLRSLVEVASNDDALVLNLNRVPTLVRRRAQVSFNYRAGINYYIAIDGVNASAGDGVLSWFLQPDGGFPLPQVTVVRNPESPSVLPGDEVSLAAVVAPDGVTGTRTIYRWFFNGVVMPTSDSPNLPLGTARTEIVGSYVLHLSRIPDKDNDPTRDVLVGPVEIQLNTGGERQAFAMDKVEFLRAPSSNAPVLLSQTRAGAGRHATAATPTQAYARGFSGAQVFSLYGATSDPTEPTNCSVPPNQSRWLIYTSLLSGPLTIKTTEAKSLPVVSAAYGPNVPDLRVAKSMEVAYLLNQDSCRHLQFLCAANKAYHIATDFDPAVPGNRTVTNHYQLKPAPIRDATVTSVGSGQWRIDWLSSPQVDPTLRTDPNISLLDAKVISALAGTFTATAEPALKSILLTAASASAGGEVTVQYTLRRKTSDPGIVDDVTGDVIVTLASSDRVRLVVADASTRDQWQEAYGNGEAVFLRSPKPTSALPAGMSLQGAAASAFGYHTWSLNEVPETSGALAATVTEVPVAGCFYSTGSFKLSLTQAADKTRRVALYFLDWDGKKPGITKRVQRITIREATAQARELASYELREFHQGVYLVWDIQGSVDITVDRLQGSNAVLNAIFLPDSAAKSVYLGRNTHTQGHWQELYRSSEAFPLWKDVTTGASPPLPAGLSITSGASSASGYHTWRYSSGSKSATALTVSGGTAWVEGCYFSSSSVLLNLVQGASQTRRLGLYFLDWDGQAASAGRRSQRVVVKESGASGKTLSTHELKDFQGGVYLTWDIQGPAEIVMTKLTGNNAVVGGVFSQNSPKRFVFLGRDNTTGRQATRLYGTQDAVLMGKTDLAKFPTWLTLPNFPSPPSRGIHTWSQGSGVGPDGTLSSPAGSDWIAGCAYASSDIVVKVQQDPLQLRRLALHFLDWDGKKSAAARRSQRVTVKEPTSGLVLGRYDLQDFQNGATLVWEIQGPAEFTISKLQGANAVISGIFAGPPTTLASPASASTFGFSNGPGERDTDNLSLQAPSSTISNTADRSGSVAPALEAPGTLAILRWEDWMDFRITGPPESRWEVEESEDLVAWTRLTEIRCDRGGRARYLSSSPVGGTRFYRLRHLDH